MANVDITTIGIEMDTTSVKAGTADLNKAAIAGQKMADSLDKSADKVVKAGAKQEQAYKEVAREAAAAARKQEQEAERAARKMQEAAAQAARSAQNQSRGIMQNLGWQTQDAIVQLQMGTAAATVFSQQGSQLASAWNPMLGLFVAVAGVVGGALYNAFGNATESTEELSEKIRELNKDYTSLMSEQRAVLIDEQTNKLEELNKQIVKQTENIGDLEKKYAEMQATFDRQKTPSMVTGFAGGQSDIVTQQSLIDMTEKLRAARGALATTNQEVMLTDQDIVRLNGEKLAGDKENLTAAQELIKSLEDEKAALELSGDAMADYIAKKAQATGADYEKIKSLYMEIEALQLKEEQEKKARQEADRALRIEEQRAKSIGLMTAQMQREADLFGVTSREAQTVYDIKKGLINVQGGLNGVEAQGLIIGAQRIDQLTAQKAATDQYVDSLKKWVAEQNKLAEQETIDFSQLSDGIDSIGGAWSKTGSIIVDAFGGIADAMGDYLDRLDEVGKQERKLQEYREKYANNPEAMKKATAAQTKLDKERVSASISGYKTMAGAAAQMFDEQSKARKVLHSLEMGFSVIEMAMAIQRSFLAAKEAVISQGKGDPYTAWARMAAMGAAVAALGYAVGGGGSGGGGTSAAQVQESQGTGSVLGSNDKSESLEKAFDRYADIGLEQLDVLRDVRDSLKTFSGGIEQLSMSFSTSMLADKKYFAFQNQSFGHAMNVGLEIGGSKKEHTEMRQALSPMQGEIKAVLGFMADTVTEGVKSLGIDFEKSIYDYWINIGKVSFEDMTAEEINQELAAIFSKEADLLTGFLVPALAEFQQMGEGLFETITRVAAEMATFNYFTDAMGLSFNATGLSAIAVQQNIAELSGGMDKLTENMQTYYEEFFSEEERAANQMKLLSAEMKNLGYDIVPSSREGFRNLVDAIDLTTEAGQKQFAGLMSLSEVFADLIPETESIVAAQRSAADIAKERANLERQLLQLQGDTATLRAQDLSALDASNQALQLQIWALQDQAIAAKEAETAARALEQAQKAIASERYNLEGQLLQAQGDTAAMRNRELEKLDESNRAIQLQIWALEDLAAANNLAAQSAAELASEQQRISDDLAQKQNQIASERYGLETQLLQVQGENDELRARELLQLDESNMALQSQIWALEDQKAASEMAAKAAEKEAQEKERAADEQRKAQQRAADDAAKAQQKAMDDARKAAEEQRKLAQGVHDSISDALRSLMGESEAFNQMGMAQARQTLQGALSVAQKGGSLVGYAGLEDALGVIQNLDASRFGSAFEYNQAMGQNIGLLSQLEQYTRVNGSHANGLDYVPFDGYVAQLHKGERVMTSAENKGQGELIAEIRALRSDLKSGDNATNGKMLSLLRIVEKWDGDGLPLERVS